MGMSLAIAQNVQVNGTVLDDTGEPIIGASVVVKGAATIGTVTNVDGQFNLSIPSKSTTLVISYLGMATKEVAAGTNLQIILQSATTDLDEVIVVAYGTAKKSTFTGAAATVKAEQLEKRQVSNVTQALSGAVAGVQTLSSNGQPGTSATIRIRGIGSINAGSSPLYVVDGVPFDGDIASLNLSDIENMTVLKDAASAALYGSRAANGVIIVTTKKGKTGKTQINFDGRIGVNQRAYPTYDMVKDPATYIEKVYEALYNGAIYNSKMSPAEANIYANETLPIKSSGGLGYQIYTVPAGELQVGTDGKLNPNATLGYSDGKNYYIPDDWADNTFKDRTRQEYNLNISGGNDKLTYFLSLGYLNDQGIIPESGYERYSMRANGDYQVNKWLKMGANFNYAYSNSRYPGDQTATASSANAFFIANMIAPIYPLYIRDADGSISIDSRGNKIYDYGDGKYSAGNRSFMSIANPVGSLYYDKEAYLSDILGANWYATATIIEGLNATARVALHVDNTRYNTMSNPYYGQSSAYGGTVYQYHGRTFGLDRQFLLNYTKTFEDVHNLDIMVGYDGYDLDMTRLDASGQNMYNPTIGVINNTIDNKRPYGYGNTYATEGYLSRINYDYDEKYFASISFRRDGSSRFHPDNRWGNFWSGSAAWILSREELIQSIDWINQLKLKASFGQQGNDDIQYNAIRNYYPYLDQYQLTGADGVFSDGTLYRKGNKDITWETSNSFNVGLDFTIFNGKLSGTIDYFLRQTSDMLYNKPVSPSAGYSSIPMNIGSMRNSGLELDLSSQIYRSNDITWTVNANATFLKNKIIELHPDLNGELIDGTRIYSEGHSMYRMYLVRYAGVDPDSGEALYYAVNKEDGSLYTTANWSEANNYKAPTGDLLPTVYGGFGTTLTFFGFDASIQLAYQLGGEIYDSGYRSLMHGGHSSYAGYGWHKDILNAWSETNRNTDVPRLDSQDTYTISTSDRWLTSSDYLSINNITLGYTLPKNILKKLDVEKVRIYCAADNVALFSARTGLDPRQGYVSATSARYSPIRSISGGISLTF